MFAQTKLKALPVICGAILLIIPHLEVKPLSAATDNIVRLVFVNESIYVEPSVVSGVLTVQLQNASGESENTSETMDAIFESTSSTGEFLGSTGKPVTKTMSTGSANKSFYYKDSTVGSPTITVTVTGRTSGTKFGASSVVHIGETGSDVELDTDTDTDDSSSSSDTNNNKVTVPALSSKTLASYIVHTPSQVVAHRLAYFWIEGLKNEVIPDVVWNFGDGVVAYGASATHIYENVGKYVVATRLPSLGDGAVTTNEIVVVEPALDLVKIEDGSGGFVEVANISGTVFDIGGYTLHTDKKTFLFPLATYIRPKGTIKISNKVSTLWPFNHSVILEAPDGSIVDKIESVKHVVSTQTLSTMSAVHTVPIIPTASAKISLVSPVPVVISNVADTIADKQDPEPEARVSATVSTTSQKLVIARKSSWFARLVGLPKFLIGSIIEAI